MPLPTTLSDFNFRENEPNLLDYLGTSIASPYFQGWQSVFQYCYDVKSGIRKAAKNEILGVDRFMSDLDREDIKLDFGIIELLFIVANSLKHSKGAIAGQQIKLLPWQIFCLVNVFAWVYTDNVSDKSIIGERRFQKVFSFVARGNAKTQISAIASIMSLLLTRNGNPVVTTSASTRKQAAICFEEIKAQIQSSSKSLKKRFKCRTNDIQLTAGGSIIPTSSEAGTIDGIRITTGILDELHTHKDSSVHDVIVSGTASSKDPLIFGITTAGTNVNSFAKSIYDYAVNLLEGVYQNDRYFVQIFEADRSLEADDETAWEQANPSIDHAVSRSTLRSNYQSSQMSPAALAGFETKHLNRWFQYSENGLIDYNALTEIQAPLPDDDYLRDLECYVGIDLAAISDLTSVAIAWVDPDKEKTYCRTQSFLSQKAFDDLHDTVKNIYFDAVKAGCLTVTPGQVTDFEVLHEYVNELCERYKPEQVGLDAAAGGQRWAQEHEDRYYRELAIVPQGFGLSEPAQRMLRMVFNNQIQIDEKDNLLAWALMNCRVQSGEWGDVKVHRPKNNNNLKIDPAIAGIIAISLVPAVKASFGIR